MTIALVQRPSEHFGDKRRRGIGDGSRHLLRKLALKKLKDKEYKAANHDKIRANTKLYKALNRKKVNAAKKKARLNWTETQKQRERIRKRRSADEKARASGASLNTAADAKPLEIMDRPMLSDIAWHRIAPLIVGWTDQKGTRENNNRMFVEGVLWIVHTGSPWRDLPKKFGSWNSVFRRFSRWSADGIWWRIFEVLTDDPSFGYIIVDSNIVRAHRHDMTAPKGGLKIMPH